MKISRINNEKNLEKEVDRIQININGKRFTLTESFGELHIHAHSDCINVKPCCANEIKIDSYDT